MAGQACNHLVLRGNSAFRTGEIDGFFCHTSRVMIRRPRSSQAHDGRSQQREAELASNPEECSAVWLVAFFGNEGGNPFVDNGGNWAHPS